MNCKSAKRLTNTREMRTNFDRVGYIFKLLHTEQLFIISTNHYLKLKKLMLCRKPDTGVNISLLLKNFHQVHQNAI